jgi:hypothetical protein
MINLTREEAQQVLDALTRIRWAASERDKKNRVRDFDDAMDVSLASIKTLRTKLSEPEPQPVAWRKLWEGETEYTYYWSCRYKGSEPLYTTPPPQRDETSAKAAEWVGLTEHEKAIWKEPAIAAVLWTEMVLREKNYDKR